MTGTAVSPGSGSSNGGLPSGTAAIDKGCWTVGLMNSKFKYLSAETFGFRINANGKALMKKQVRVNFVLAHLRTQVAKKHANEARNMKMQKYKCLN